MIVGGPVDINIIEDIPQFYIEVLLEEGKFYFNDKLFSIRAKIENPETNVIINKSIYTVSEC